MTDKIYFGYHPGNPLDGLSDASGVLDMLSSFIASSDDLHAFEYNDSNRSMHGLCVVLDCAQRAIDTAYDDLLEERTGERADSTVDQQAVPKQDLPALKKKFKDLIRSTEGSETGDDSFPKLPPLSAREAAIAETYRKGYPAEEIASAVNLKQAKVEQIIGQLKNAGSIPLQPDNLSHAASA